MPTRPLRSVVALGASALLLAALASCGNDSETADETTDPVDNNTEPATNESASAEEGETWQGRYMGRGAATPVLIGPEEENAVDVTAECSGDAKLPTITISFKSGWTATSTQPAAKGGPAEVEIASPEGDTATITDEHGDLMWHEGHALTADADGLDVDGHEWKAQWEGFSCLK